MLAFILYVLLGWFLFNLVFRFIIPVYRTTKRMKKKFREMSEQQMNQQGFKQPASTQASSPSSRNEDYIDFEEIK